MRQAEDLGSNPSECHIFLFVPLSSFFSATLAKRWKVQFRQGFAQFNNVDSIRRHKYNYENEVAMLQNGISRGQ